MICASFYRLRLVAALAIPALLASPLAAKEIAPSAKAFNFGGEKTNPNLRMAQLALDAKENKLAADQARLALKTDAKLLEAKRILAVALFRDGQTKEALTVLEQLAKELPGDTWVQQTRAAILLESGDKKGALATMDRHWHLRLWILRHSVSNHWSQRVSANRCSLSSGTIWFRIKSWTRQFLISRDWSLIPRSLMMRNTFCKTMGGTVALSISIFIFPIIYRNNPIIDSI